MLVAGKDKNDHDKIKDKLDEAFTMIKTNKEGAADIIRSLLPKKRSLSGLKDKKVDDKEVLERCKKIGCSENFRSIVGYACNGLERLQTTYKRGNVVLAIQLQLNFLRDALAGKEISDRLPQHFNMEDNLSFIDYNKIKLIWDLETIEGIYQQFHLAYRSLNSGTNPEPHVKSIVALLDEKDRTFKSLVMTKS